MFSEKIIQLRMAKSWSCKHLAEVAGVDQSLLNKIEQRKRPPTDRVIQRLSVALGVTFDELKAYAEADQLGPSGLSRLKRFVFDAWPTTPPEP